MGVNGTGGVKLEFHSSLTACGGGLGAGKSHQINTPQPTTFDPLAGVLTPPKRTTPFDRQRGLDPPPSQHDTNIHDVFEQFKFQKIAILLCFKPNISRIS